MSANGLPKKQRSKTSPRAPQIRLAIFDPLTSVRELLAMTLERERSFSLAATGNSGAAAIRACQRDAPDLLILDLDLREKNGAAVLRTLGQKYPEIKTLVWSGSESAELHRAALAAKPGGFVHKRESLATLLEALAVVIAGSSYLSPFARKILRGIRDTPPDAYDTLTKSGRIVLKMVAQGKNNREIAARLKISNRTVEYHRTRMMECLGLKGSAAVTRYAVQKGVIAQR